MSDNKGLWPRNFELPSIGVTGKYGSGKTLFGLLADPERTLVYDSENSSASIASQLQFDRVSITEAMVCKFPKGYKAMDMYLWWRDHFRQIEPGKYRVIILDTATDIEKGLIDWVRKNPAYFGKTTGQYAKMSGLVSGDAKTLMKAHIQELSERCETFFFTTHLGKVWKDGAPTTQDKPKGSDVFFECSSLYLQLERKPDPQGNVPDVPSGKVLKGRVCVPVRRDGRLRIVNCLPPRMPECSYYSLCAYIENPPDSANLRPEELAPAEEPTQEELLHKEAAIVNARKEAAALELELESMRQERDSHAPVERAQANTSPQPIPQSPDTLPSTPTEKPPEAPAATEQEEKPSKAQLEALVRLRQEWWESCYRHDHSEDRETAWAALLRHNFGVSYADELSSEEFAALVDRLETERDGAAAQREAATMQGEAPPF